MPATSSASLGGAAAYIGRVRDDKLGQSFADDLRATGVEFSVPPATDGPATGRCIIVVTPDAQRTMNTYLGASTDLGPGDVEPDLIARASRQAEDPDRGLGTGVGACHDVLRPQISSGRLIASQ